MCRPISAQQLCGSLMLRVPELQNGSAFFRSFPLENRFTISYLFKEAFGYVFMKSLPSISRDLGHSSWDDVLFTQMEN